ncbi:MAG: ABC transporter permease, partial [Nocardiopsaceae bacterium]|nr:ABC transporter permease [Nocardiopsaceae bacterium]
MTALLGTRALAGLAYRRDRLLLPVWVYLIFIGTVANALEMRLFYQTPASRESLAASGRSTPALLFLYGQLHGTSVGALTVWHYGVWASLFAGLMSVLTVVRHSRANEESGRQELIGSARVGRQAPLASALLMAVAANVVAAALLCVVLPLVGLDVAGSVAFALAVGACGLAFAGIAGVAAQLASGARGTRGLAIAVLGLSFLLRS